MSSTESLPTTVVVDRPSTAPSGSNDAANRAFSVSILISAVRCTLSYVVFPWFLPAIGLASGVGPGIGVAIGVVAIGFNIASIRRFWAANHQWKVPITVLNCAVIAMLLVLVGLDVADLLS